MPNLWFPIDIGFCPSQVEWDKLMENCKIDEWFYPERNANDRGHAHCNNFPGPSEHFSPFTIITVSEKAEKQYDGLTVIGLLAHECVHAVRWLFEMIGEDKPSEEFECYSVQAVLQFMIREYNRTRWEPLHGQAITAPKIAGATPREVGTRANRGISRKHRSDTK